jgi:predicted phage-related endonuclease
MLTDAQKKERLGKITSSVVAACLGVDERMSQIDAWLRIRGEAPDVATKAIDRGNRLEDLILDYPAMMLGLDRKPAPFRQHPEHGQFGDSCDALYVNRDLEARPVAIGEGKSASLGVSKEYGQEGTDEMPQHTLLQSHWHLIHWPEVERCYVPVLVGGYAFEFRLYHVDRDPELHGIMIDELLRWHHDHIVEGKTPPVTHHEADAEWLKKKYPAGLSGALADSPEIQEWAKRKALAAKIIKEASKEEEQAKNELRRLLGDHEFVLASWGKVTWKKSAEAFATDWERAVYALQDEFKLDPAQVREVVGKHTEMKPGQRKLLVTYKEQI